MKTCSKSRLLATGAVLPLCLLAGCGTTPAVTTVQPAGATLLGTLSGKVHGGQQPLAYPHIYVYAVGTSGYGTVSTSLLLPGSGTTQDANGVYYVTADRYGNFSVTGQYVCLAGTQVYAYVSGGNAGAGNNPAIGLMAGLGQCPSTGTLALQVPFVEINELSTVVAAYALAGFATDATHISSSGTALAATGVANAMANALNIYSFTGGNALSQTANGTATVPVSQIDTLGNILAACVNSGTSNGVAGACATLFAAATGNGADVGPEPADTASAAINFAQHPFHNVSSLYALQTSAAPFQPSQTVAPPDLTLGLFYTTPEFQLNQSSDPNASTFDTLAFDSKGDPWTRGLGRQGAEFVKHSPTGEVLANLVTAQDADALETSRMDIDSQDSLWDAGATGEFEISSGGTLLSPANGFKCTGMQGLNSTVFSPSGIVYIGTFYVSGSTFTTAAPIWKLDPLTGSCLGALMSSSGDFDGYLAIDNSGNIFDAGTDQNFDPTIFEFQPPVAAPLLIDSTGVEGDDNTIAASFIRLDHSGNLWRTNCIYCSTALQEFSPANQIVSPASGYPGGGLTPAPGYTLSMEGTNGPDIDGAGAMWEVFQPCPTAGGNCALEFITGVHNDGTAITPATGLVAFTLDDLQTANAGYLFGGLAADGSGNLWGLSAYGGLVQYLGLTTPVATPILYNNAGVRP